MPGHSQNTPHPVADIFETVSSYLKFLSDIGYTGEECSDTSLERIAVWGKDSAKAVRKGAGLSNNVKKCRECSLSAYRQNMICGQGDAKAPLAVVGGAASADDMKTGTPYSGQAGALLDKMLAAMGFSRGQVYVTRAVKCCPPENQNPDIADVKICRAYLEKELKLIRPRIICAFGEVAAMSLLETAVPLSRLRGRFHDFKGMRVMPTYSPEYLLDHPGAKRTAWEDLKQVIQFMGSNLDL